jgi:hypothetical protein
MVHASPEQAQAALPAEGVVAGQNDHRIGTNELIDQ